MNYTEKLQHVSVLGAAGKMGSGILLLTALEMTDLSLQPENKNRKFVINAIDLSFEALQGLIDYIKVQALKAAEKKTVQLRTWYSHRADLIENGDIIQAYVDDVLRIIHLVTDVKAAYESNIIFEAVNENKALKVKLFTDIDKNNPNKPWFLSNTSSVPIHEIDDEANLGGRIMGVHFYNPPAIQRLVELIAADKTLPEVKEFATQFSKNLRKVVVHSNDFAGFIGNGHFMRDALFGIQLVEGLLKNNSFAKAIYMVNKVTQDYLVRPMGIFQLIDYVGVDVVQFIMKVMNPHLPDENLHSQLLDKMMLSGIKGGQNADGSQKDGFFTYERGKLSKIFDLNAAEYVSFDSIAPDGDLELGAMPENAIAWKSIIRDANQHEKLKSWFHSFQSNENLGAKLALAYGTQSCNIGMKLVNDQVALSVDDVNTVMMTGFFHAYGPINNYFTS